MTTEPIMSRRRTEAHHRRNALSGRTNGIHFAVAAIPPSTRLLRTKAFPEPRSIQRLKPSRAPPASAKHRTPGAPILRIISRSVIGLRSGCVRSDRESTAPASHDPAMTGICRKAARSRHGRLTRSRTWSCVARGYKPSVRLDPTSEISTPIRSSSKTSRMTGAPVTQAVAAQHACGGCVFPVEIPEQATRLRAAT